MKKRLASFIVLMLLSSAQANACNLVGERI